ncbi:BON domain-containing protein [Pelagibacteraceae bacterium]|nr:BON domain-containing protein [Pelagibacteraceae bacterium]
MSKKKIYLLIIFLCVPYLFSACAQVLTGTAAKVITVTKEDRTIGEFVDDALIKTVIKNTYFDQSGNLFFNVDVEVSQGRVLLTGTVENMDLKIEATRIAWGVEDVKTVINELQISNSDNIFNFADDLVISTKVSGRLILEAEVNSLNYNIETVNKVVYIIGIANSDDEQKKVIDIASDVYGVEGVIDYITIKAPLN